MATPVKKLKVKLFDTESNKSSYIFIKVNEEKILNEINRKLLFYFNNEACSKQL
jgi:hypothetical protein